MADSYFTLSSSVVFKTDNKVKPIVSNRFYRFNNKKTWNDVFEEAIDPEEVNLKKTDQILVSLGQSWTNICARHGGIWCSKKKICLPTYPYPKVMGRVWAN